jgi:single-strand DNA-binding protein
MAGSINKVILVGNLGADPEIRSTQDGREIANFSIATSDSWNDKATGEKREKTEWHRIVVFQPGLVNVIKQYIKKGSKLYIEGSLQTRKWTDNAGVEKYSTEVVIQGFNGNITMLDSRSGGGDFGSSPAPSNSGSAFEDKGTFSSAPSAPKESSGDDKSEDFDDEIPF